MVFYQKIIKQVTVRPDYEGKLKDVDDGLESIEDILREVYLGEDSIKSSWRWFSFTCWGNSEKKIKEIKKVKRDKAV